MKTTYIYLNTYLNGYLYVGSHTWDGPEGVLDPNYHGSSTVAEVNHWAPVKEEILEVVSEDRKFIAEREWINFYADREGIADAAQKLYRWSRVWINTKPKHGRLLNCHCNNAEQATEAARSKESRIKKVEHTDYKEVQRKRFETLTKEKRSMAAAKTAAKLGPDFYRNLIKKHNDAVYSSGRRCILNDGFVGVVSDIVAHTGLPKGSVGAKVSQAYKYGESKCQGWIFRPLRNS